MEVFRTVTEMRAYGAAQRAAGKKVALVPTMGCLHEGHLSLMKAAKQECDTVIASVFVNPVQFGPNEDYEAYPRQEEKDREALERAGVDAMFCPTPTDMYPSGYGTYVQVESEITKKLCGAKRPGHFRGVATVVTKLMNITGATHAFFGQKDAQQVVVIRRFVEDLNLPVTIHMVPIVREETGLARSSRNTYLSREEKASALILSQSLAKAEAAFQQGERNATALKQLVTTSLRQEPLARIDYVELYTFPALQDIETIQEEPVLLAIAVYIGKTRLIDNCILGGQ